MRGERCTVSGSLIIHRGSLIYGAAASKRGRGDWNGAIKEHGAFSRRFIGGRRMFHSYFYTPFMDAPCAGISLISTSVAAYNLMRAVCACRAIGKGKTALRGTLPARRTTVKLLDVHSMPIPAIRRLSLQFFVLYLLSACVIILGNFCLRDLALGERIHGL